MSDPRVPEVCAQYNWKYVLTLKEGRQPALWDELLTLMQMAAIHWALIYHGFLKRIYERAARATETSEARAIAEGMRAMAFPAIAQQSTLSPPPVFGTAAPGERLLRGVMNGDIFISEMKRARRIYLDVCCLNRPFDDLQQERVRLEAEAVKSVLVYIGSRLWIGIGSEVINFEIGRIPDPDRQLEVGLIVSGFSEHIKLEEAGVRRGLELEVHGFGAVDALHLACAEQARADVLLTTDDLLLRKAIKYSTRLSVRVANPWTWMEEVLRR